MKVSCFYNCGASGLTLKNIEDHYAKFHRKLKSYYRYQDFQCDSCLNYFSRSLLYSPARTQEELNSSPHYCSSCMVQFQSAPTNLKPKKNMNKRILSPKTKTKKTKSKLKPRKASLKPKRALKSKVSKIKKSKLTALTLKPSFNKKTKNNPAYYNCLLNQAKSGFKGKITKACSECRTNAPALNLAYKKEAQKLVKAYRDLGVSLSKILSH